MGRPVKMSCGGAGAGMSIGALLGGVVSLLRSLPREGLHWVPHRPGTVEVPGVSRLDCY